MAGSPAGRLFGCDSHPCLILTNSLQRLRDSYPVLVIDLGDKNNAEALHPKVLGLDPHFLRDARLKLVSYFGDCHARGKQCLVVVVFPATGDQVRKLAPPSQSVLTPSSILF